MVNMKSDLLDFTGGRKAENDKAIIFNDGTKDYWLPKSQVEIHDLEDGKVEVTVPYWLAYQRGMI